MATKGGRGPKAKGDRFERDLADYLNHAIPGLKAARAPLSGGGASHGLSQSADLIGTPYLHIEAKRTERFAPYAAISQAEEALSKSEAPEAPVVINRKNRQPLEDSLVVLRLSDFAALYHSHLLHTGHITGRDDGS